MAGHPPRPVVCSIGSTDPTAGAGLFSDAETFRRAGVSAAYVVAGVTAQNSARVDAVAPLPPRVVLSQLKSVWEQVRPDAVRIGLVPGAPAILAVHRFFRSMSRRPPIVIDPVLAATSGRRFARAREIEALRRLLTVATIMTPNIDEAAVLARMKIRDLRGIELAASRLAAKGSAVLVTGGHLQGGWSVDVLARGNAVTRYRGRRIARDMRGAGCVLAAALAAYIARGDALDVAVRRARTLVRRAIATSQPLGRGRPQPDTVGSRRA